MKRITDAAGRWELEIPVDYSVDAFKTLDDKTFALPIRFDKMTPAADAKEVLPRIEEGRVVLTVDGKPRHPTLGNDETAVDAALGAA